jgi:hypothetical protein
MPKWLDLKPGVSSNALRATRNPQRATRNPQRATRNAQPATICSSSGEAGASRMGGDGLPDELLQLFAEYLAIELPRVGA